MLRVWCLAPDQRDHIRPIEDEFGTEAQFIYDSDCHPARMLEAKPDIALCVNEFRLCIADCLHAAQSRQIPTLLLQDGILDWRCQYENPLFAASGGPPQHQPILADKIACIGHQSARILRSWSNTGKVHVTGMPRLDHLLSRSKVPRQKPGNRVLVATAKNPGFTPEQRETTIRSLLDVAAELNKRPHLGAAWRISPELARQLDITNRFSEFSSRDFASTLEQSDALITTPSTSMLEAMVLDRPVAALDYHNVPQFVPTVWRISAPEQIANVLDDMLGCPENKIHYQSCLLHDCLACDGPAAARVAQLIRQMADGSKQDSASGQATEFSNGSQDQEDHCFTKRPLDLSAFYPDQAIFRLQDIAVLQAHLARLRKENERLQNQLASRTLTNGLFKAGRVLSAHLVGKP